MTSQVVVVTGANGFVGSYTVKALAQAGATVRAIVRRPGTAPVGEGIEEHVGAFHDIAFADRVLAGASAVITTAHPMWSDELAQRLASVEATPAFVRAARDAGVTRAVHLSSAAVYARPPGSTDIDEASPLVGLDGGDYAAAKRLGETALAQIDGVTGIFIRPAAISGPGETSEFNTIRPAAMLQRPGEIRVNPDLGISWVHVADLATLLADLALGRMVACDDPARGPVDGAWTPLNVTTGPINAGEYVRTVIAGSGIEPVWTDEPVWTGHIRGDRARQWGWTPVVTRDQALAEIAAAARALRDGGDGAAAHSPR